MEEFPCSIRIFKVKQMTTAEKTETYWIEAVWEGKKSLFRICHYSKRGHFLAGHFPLAESRGPKRRQKTRRTSVFRESRTRHLCGGHARGLDGTRLHGWGLRRRRSRPTLETSKFRPGFGRIRDGNHPEGLDGWGKTRVDLVQLEVSVTGGFRTESDPGYGHRKNQDSLIFPIQTSLPPSEMMPFSKSLLRMQSMRT